MSIAGTPGIVDNSSASIRRIIMGNLKYLEI
jgi:hypothetical protein